ncbi:hypothetical protein OG871_01470 [Kitasatospora sp. NBC_00374]|uniref:hypothetical protein n=1 Tax=Kitasatospora sp. NBC_00374 TaxID=2975964 RepID=UPI0030E4FCFC
MTLDRSTDPVAVALGDALVRRVREFPAVRSVWAAQVRWRAGGEERLVLHVAVDEDLPSASAGRLMQILLGEEVKLGRRHPEVGMLRTQHRHPRRHHRPTGPPGPGHGVP